MLLLFISITFLKESSAGKVLARSIWPLAGGNMSGYVAASLARGIQFLPGGYSSWQERALAQ
jgi:hypothetical protein